MTLTQRDVSSLCEQCYYCNYYNRFIDAANPLKCYFHLEIIFYLYLEVKTDITTEYDQAGRCWDQTRNSTSITIAPRRTYTNLMLFIVKGYLDFKVQIN